MVKNQFLRVYAGWDFRNRKNGYYNPNNGDNIYGNKNTKNNRQVFCVGVQYLLPLFILADLREDNTGLIRLQIGREDIPITKRLRLTYLVNTDLEYMIGARYILTKYITLSTHYDGDMKWGAGIAIIY